MEEKPSQKALPFGLLELNNAGIVIGYSPVDERYSTIKAEDVIGLNFFTEILSKEDARELWAKFYSYMLGDESVERLTSVFPSEIGNIKIQIVMAHLPEKRLKGKERLA